MVEAPELGAPTPGIGTATRRPELRLVDVSQQVGLQFRYDTGRSPYRWLMETLGGGVAVLDFDLDGWSDIYLTQGGPLPVGDRPRESNRLFRNVDGGQATDVTGPTGLAHYGYGQGCAVGDYDSDGFPDLVVCNYGETAVFRNHGDGTFADVTASCGVTKSGWSTSAAFSDIDRDGDLDLYVVRYLEAPFETLQPCKFKGGYTSCRPFNYEAAQDVFLGESRRRTVRGADFRGGFQRARWQRAGSVDRRLRRPGPRVGLCSQRHNRELLLRAVF